MSDCLFCKIANGSIPTEFLYEDDKVAAFRDINPAAPVHILIIPKEHIVCAADICENNSLYVAKCFEAIAKIAKAEGLQEGFRVVNNCGEDAGQTVFHIHFHVLAGKTMGGFA